MAWKDLLVHIDDGKASPGRVAAAIALARAHAAHLTGLYVVAEPELPGFLLSELPAAWHEQTRRQGRERAERAAARFREAAARAGLSADCRIDRGLEGEVSAVVAVHARYADLVILGQADPDEPEPASRPAPEAVVLGCGRPAIVVPYIGAGPTIGERVVVAWDAGREATRAVNDALPLLTKAKSVIVLSANPRPTPAGHGAEPGADIAQHLARHGVKVAVEHIEASDIAVADAILSRLADAGADLLVMGAYGHSRARELLLGGVTRQVLPQMTVPVLMSH